MFQYRDQTTGKEREHQFGHYPEMSLSDARDRCAELRARHKAAQPLINEPQTTLTIADIIDA
ncbi:Arm DNA-binding domain-containing protein [Jannaschia faecimaris]|uniref:Arm DNA-binding domain-containing protein n=1 Tax=Jannaschia faecimaris TaxID=1244108 RepID=UPI000B85CE64